MIYTLENTNLLEWLKEQTEPSALAHQSNCFHTFGSGIARQIANVFPKAYEADKESLKGSKDKLGSFTYAQVFSEPNRFVYNMYSQFSFGHGRETKYDAMVDALDKIRTHAISKGLTRLGVPYNIGCALGGGDWRIVRAIIDSIFDGDEEINLYICRFDPK